MIDEICFSNLGKFTDENYVDFRPWMFKDSHHVYNGLLKLNMIYNTVAADTEIPEMLFSFFKYIKRGIPGNFCSYRNDNGFDSTVSTYFKCGEVTYMYRIGFVLSKHSCVVKYEEMYSLMNEREVDKTVFVYDLGEVNIPWITDDSLQKQIKESFVNVYNSSTTLLSHLISNFGNIEPFKTIAEFFNSIVFYEPNAHYSNNVDYIKMISTDDGRKAFSKFAHAIDDSIDRVTVHRADKNNVESHVEKITVARNRYICCYGEYIKTKTETVTNYDYESKMFREAMNLFAFIYANRGKTLLINNIDNVLSPHVLRALLIVANVTNTQIVASFNHVDIVYTKFLRRDEICIVDYNCGIAHITAIPDYKFDMDWSMEFENFSSQMLRGEFGGVPQFAGFDDLTDFLEKQTMG